MGITIMFLKPVIMFANLNRFMFSDKTNSFHIAITFFHFLGTIQYTMRAYDEENDVIEYLMQPSFNVSNINGTIFLSKTGT